MVDLVVVLSNLSSNDFDPMRVEARGIETLSEVGEAIEAHEKPTEIFATVFHFMERLDSCDLGAPGPLVHALEAVGGYELELTASVMRKPTSLTLWMVNRILNATNSPKLRSKYLRLLARSVSHPRASIEARTDAAQFLEQQGAAV